MTLTYYTNYSLRTMIYLGLHASSLASISQISEAFRISRNHLIKVVHNLAKQGLIKTTRGRGGGLRLARDPKDINLGDVVRRTEANLNLVECFDSTRNTCPLVSLCELKGIVREAEMAFLSVLDRYTLADLLGKRKQMAALLKIPYTRQNPLWLAACNGRKHLTAQRS
jgi:Rrf2 family transcriptional regulator, nitric oxide-sensitive transcriptional repressor